MSDLADNCRPRTMSGVIEFPISISSSASASGVENSGGEIASPNRSPMKTSNSEVRNGNQFSMNQTPEASLSYSQDQWRVTRVRMPKGDGLMDQERLDPTMCSQQGFNLHSRVGLYQAICFLQQQKIRMPFQIPDIVFLSGGCISAWLFTAKDGIVRRKGVKKLSSAAVASHFETVAGMEENFENWRAVVMDEPCHVLGRVAFEKLVSSMLAAEGGANIDTPAVITSFHKPRDDIGWDCHLMRQGGDFMVCHTCFRYSERYRTVPHRKSQPKGTVFQPIPYSLELESTRTTVLVLRTLWRAHTSVDFLRCEFIQDYRGWLILVGVSTKPLPEVPLPK